MRISSILISGAVAAVAVAGSAMASASTIYSNIPSPIAGHYPSIAFNANTVSQLGNRINFGGSARLLTTATVTMVNWSRFEDYNVGGIYYYSGQWAGSGFNHDFTLNFYAAGTGNTPGALLHSVTQSKFIAYRPTGWATNGYAQNISFDLSALNFTVPDSIVWTIGYNTQTAGSNPLGPTNPGPYDALNVGVGPTPTTVGSSVDTTFFVQSPAYNNGSTILQWAEPAFAQNNAYTPMAEFTAVPAPGAVALLGMAGLAGSRRRRS